jgi:hypothetical protein
MNFHIIMLTPKSFLNARNRIVGGIISFVTGVWSCMQLFWFQESFYDPFWGLAFACLFYALSLAYSVLS